MNILYVEDEEEKAREVMTYLSKNNNVDLKKSYSSGVSAIYECSYDLILLDMSLPLYDYDSEDEDENEFDTFGGVDIIDELVRLSRTEKVAIITAFDILGEDDIKIDVHQLDKKLRSEYANNYVGTIYYDASSLEWRRELQEILKKYEDTNS
jgi:CheY-like chemotaxis protein